MMTNLIKANIDKFITSKILIICLVFSLYSINLKKEAHTLQISYWEYVIYALTDHYYILYFMIISFIFIIFNIFKQTDEIIWIRTRSYIKFFMSQIVSLIVISSVYVLLHVIVTLTMGIGLSFNNQYTSIIADERFTIRGFSHYYSTPFSASCLIVIYMILGFSFLGILFLFLKQFLHEIVVIISIITLYMFMLLSIRSDLDLDFPYLFLNNYIILHHSFVVLGDAYYFLPILELITIFFIVILIKRYWNINFSFSKYFSNFFDKWNLSLLFSRNNVIIIITLTLFTILTTIFSHDTLTFLDVLFIQFNGHGVGYLNYLDFLQLIIYNGIPVYLLCYFLEKENTERSSLLMIRIRDKKSWLASILRTSLIFIVGYVTITIFITIIISFISGLSFDGFEYNTNLFKNTGVGAISPSHLIMIILSTKSLELFVCFLSIFLLYCFTNTTLPGFLLISLAYFLCLIDLPMVKFNPFGMSSLIRLEEFIGETGLSYSLSTTILFILSVLLYTSIRSGSYKRIFK